MESFFAFHTLLATLVCEVRVGASEFSIGQLFTICQLLESYIDFDSLYFRLFRLLPIGDAERTRLLPALRGPHRVILRPGFLETDLQAIFGHRGGQIEDPKYSFVITKRCHIIDFRAFHISKFEFDSIPFNDFLTRYSYNYNFISSISLNGMHCNEEVIQFFQNFANLRQLMIKHSGFNVLNNFNLNLNIKVFHFTCGIISVRSKNTGKNSTANLFFLVRLLSQLRSSLKELILHRNHYDSWTYNSYFTDYIDLFAQTVNFPKLTYLLVDLPISLNKLRALQPFLNNFPRLKSAVFVVYECNIKTIVHICETTLSFPHIARLELRYAKINASSLRYLKNLKRTHNKNHRFIYTKLLNCIPCYASSTFWATKS